MLENTFTAKLRSDKRKNPTLRTYRYMTFDEIKAMKDGWDSHCQYMDRNGDIATVKITSIKTWKTRPQIEVNCKYGMYEYFHDMLYPSVAGMAFESNFVVEVYPETVGNDIAIGYATKKNFS